MSMQFQVPQFIEVEDKIFGPFSIKQFIYVAGSLGFAFILYTQTPLIVTLLFGTPIVALGFTFAFYKVNNRPFITTLEAGFGFMTKSRLYVWKKRPKKAVRKVDDAPEVMFVPKLSDSKLKDLAWSLDVHESVRSQHEV